MPQEKEACSLVSCSCAPMILDVTMLRSTSVPGGLTTTASLSDLQTSNHRPRRITSFGPRQRAFSLRPTRRSRGRADLRHKKRSAIDDRVLDGVSSASCPCCVLGCPKSPRSQWGTFVLRLGSLYPATKNPTRQRRMQDHAFYIRLGPSVILLRRCGRARGRVLRPASALVRAPTSTGYYK